VTAACLQLDAPNQIVTVSNAGHVLPLLRRASGGVVAIGVASGPPVGMLPGQSYGEERVTLEFGDMLVLMTDGVLDALHSDADSLGLNALIDIIAAAPPNIGELNRRILDAVDLATQGHFADDVTLLTIEVMPRAG
jgi:sigma-B regulation protein RsbU (phosphoserine phosphatase)